MAKALKLNKYTEYANCKACGKKFLRWKVYQTKHCSRPCVAVTYRKTMSGNGNPFYGKRHSKETRKKLVQSHLGKPAWNKGLIGYMAGEKHYNWKGKNAGYSAIHKWVKKYFGIPDKCEHCESKKFVVWANMDHKYTRNRKTWKKLCSKCHHAFDRVNGWGVATRKYSL